MQFQAYFKQMVGKKGIDKIIVKNDQVGYKFYLTFPSYRGTHLSCIEEFGVKVDGKEISELDIQFCVNGKKFLVSQLKDLFEEYWFVLDDAAIEIYEENLMEGEHEVDVSLSYRVPYAGYGGKYMVVSGSDSKKLKVN